MRQATAGVGVHHFLDEGIEGPHDLALEAAPDLARCGALGAVTLHVLDRWGGAWGPNG